MAISENSQSTDTFRLTPLKWVSNGFTLGHHRDKTVFLTGGIPGREELVVIEKEISRIIYARVLKADSDCEAFPSCGGCSYRHISYTEEINIKKDEMLSALNIDSHISLSVITGEEAHYRNNVQWKRSGEKIGFYSRYSNDVVDLRKFGCKNLDPLLEFPPKGNHLNLRLSEGKVINYNSSDTKLAVGKYHFKIPPNGFQQINSGMIPSWLHYIQNQISRFSNEERKMDCLELFCGSGLIGQSVSENLKSLFGIEAINQSIAYARENSSSNEIKNFSYKSLDLYKPLPISTIPKCPLWILNPPRSGAGKEVIQLWKFHMPEVVIYSSCDAQSLARDWKQIQEATDNYYLDSLCLIDFFPRTKHFETVAVFVKKDFQEKAIE